MAGGHPPVTDDDRRRVAELYQLGHSRNQIAAEISRSGRTVSRICAEHNPPLTFDRARTKAATEAKVADGKARRAALALKLLDDVERIRERLHAPYTVHTFDRDGELVTGELELPPARDQQALMNATCQAIDRSMRLDAYDRADDTLTAVDAWLAAMTGEAQ